MRVVGSLIGARRERLGLLAGLVIALTALLLVSVSDAATTRAKGLDVSNWNGTINWTKVAKAGYRFAFGKATEGTAYLDKSYTANRNGSEAAGLVFGAYHFARPAGGSLAGATASALKQANHFLAVAGPQPGELPPVLDLEATGNLAKKRLLALDARLARPDLRPHRRRAVRLHLAAVLEAAPWGLDGRRCRRHGPLGRALDANGSPLVPAQNWHGEGWKFWQWTNCVSVPGIRHCSDGDRLNGTNLALVAIAPYPTGVPLLSTPPTIVGPPEAGSCSPPYRAPGWAASRSPSRTSGELCDAAGANCTAISGCDRRVVQAGHRDVGHSLKVFVTAASDARNRARHDSTPPPPVAPRRAPRRRPARRTSSAAIIGNPAERADPDDLGRNLGRLADDVHLSLAALQREWHLLHRDPPCDGAAPDAHRPTTSARRSRSS